MLGFVTKAHLHTQRSTGRRWQEGEPKQHPDGLLPGPSREPSAHQRPIFTSPEEHRGTTAGGNPNYVLARRNTLSGSLPGLFQESLSLRDQDKARQDQSGGQAFRSSFITEGGGYCLGLWDPLWDAGEECLGIALKIYVVFRGRTNGREREGSRWFRKKQM